MPAFSETPSKKILLNQIREGEGLFQEFKSSVEKVDRSIVAFANAKGGTLFIGINDQGVLVQGFKLTNRIKAQILDIARNIDPSMSVEIVDLDGAAAVIVKEGEDKPYRCADGFFMRIGAMNQKLTRDEILDLALRVNRIRFENLQFLDFKFPDDFSKKALDEFVSRAKLSSVLEAMGVEAFLISLGIAEKQRGRLLLNHAGMVFFAKNPQKWVPQAKISFARYAGTTKSSVSDRKIISGSLMEQLDSIMELLRFQIPIRYLLSSSSRRVEQPQYPIRALEEAIANALIHRDYSQDGAETQVDMYTDRIEISNPGELIGSLSVETLGKRSLRRNPIIAELFYRTGKGEKLGSGIVRMREFAKEWKIPSPEFDVSSGFFSVVFRGPKPDVPEEKLAMLTDRPRSFIEKRSLIEEPFSAASYAEVFQITTRSAQKDLQELINSGLVVREGEGKNTRYRFRNDSSVTI